MRTFQNADNNEPSTLPTENFGQSKSKGKAQKSKKVPSSKEYNPRKLAKTNTDGCSRRGKKSKALHITNVVPYYST